MYIPGMGLQHIETFQQRENLSKPIIPLMTFTILSILCSSSIGIGFKKLGLGRHY